MKIAQVVAVCVVLLVGAGLALQILRSEPIGSAPAAHDGHDEHEEHEGAAHEKGPHGGRLLTDGAFAAEITIFERGIPPEFRVYFYRDGEPLDPGSVKLAVELRRLGGRVDRFEFRAQGDYQVGGATVEEPHSFDVGVTAEHDGRTSVWEYASYEGRVQLSADAVASSGIVVETAGPATLARTLTLYGRIRPNEDRLAHVIPRYPGIATEIRKQLGDAVEKGETLAIIESNESLQPYEVKSLIAGTVINKHIAPGEFAAEGEDVYLVADLSTVWVDFNVYRQDFPKLRHGLSVTIDAGEGIPPAEGEIQYISPFGAESTQTMLARVMLPNPSGQWRPGLFVTGEVVIEEAAVALAVKATALQTFRDWEVVFIQEGDVFEVRPVELGRRDAEWVEILGGLSPGERYVGANSFILKADLGKAGAAHDH